jgi:hypothetical protein
MYINKIGGIFGISSDLNKINEIRKIQKKYKEENKEHFGLALEITAYVISILATVISLIIALRIAIPQPNKKVVHIIFALICPHCYIFYAIILARLIK